MLVQPLKVDAITDIDEKCIEQAYEIRRLYKYKSDFAVPSVSNNSRNIQSNCRSPHVGIDFCTSRYFVLATWR